VHLPESGRLSITSFRQGEYATDIVLKRPVKIVHLFGGSDKCIVEYADNVKGMRRTYFLRKDENAKDEFYSLREARSVDTEEG
jgi:hypothetical protein